MQKRNIGPRDLPGEIHRIVGDAAYETDGTGMSGSEVRLYAQHVLKIRPSSPETANEAAALQWLRGRLPVPELPCHLTENGLSYSLMTRAEGKMLCDPEILRDPELAVHLAAEGLRMLWSIDPSDCPCRESLLERRLETAARNVSLGLVDVENTEPGTFGPGGFRDPAELLDWLCRNRPAEDTVFSHGDYCLPNVFAHDGRISSFIDLGKAGPADRWQDLALAIRSLDHNFSGRYAGRGPFFDFRPSMLLDLLGIPFDAEKYRYYLLLDELF